MLFKRILAICLLLFSVNVAFADAKGDVEAAYNNWCKSVGAANGDAKQLVQYYAPGGILLPTLSNDILVNIHGGLDNYFHAFTSNKDIQCVPTKLITNVYGNVAVTTGLYGFSFTDNDGQKEFIPARFIFVYENKDGKWLITQHHSSKLPQEKIPG